MLALLRGYVSALDSEGRTIWIADAHREDGKRFVVPAGELLTAFLELEAAIRPCGATSSEEIVEPTAEYEARSYMKIRRTDLRGFL